MNTERPQTEDEAIRVQWYGNLEPDLDRNLWDVLNWYQARAKDSDARNWLIEYLGFTGRKEVAATLERVPDEWIPRTAGWLARLHVRGYALTTHNIQTIENQLSNALKRAIAEPVEKPDEIKPNVQQHIKEKAHEVIGEIEGMIDDGNNDINLYDYLRKNEISGAVTKHIINHFAPQLSEFEAVVAGDDPDLNEGYRHLTQNDLLGKIQHYRTMLVHANHHINIENKSRGIRKPKPPSVQKLLKNFTFLVKDDSRRIASIDPSRIIGAQELWTFNVKSNILTVYRANDTDGLKIKRSLIVNINEQTSFGKRIGRKTDERLKTVVEGGKVALRHLMDEINGDQLPVKRITKDTILLRSL